MEIAAGRQFTILHFSPAFIFDYASSNWFLFDVGVFVIVFLLRWLRLLRLFVHFFLYPFSLQRNERIMKWDAIVLVALLAVAIQAQGNYP